VLLHSNAIGQAEKTVLYPDHCSMELNLEILSIWLKIGTGPVARMSRERQPQRWLCSYSKLPFKTYHHRPSQPLLSTCARMASMKMWTSEVLGAASIGRLLNKWRSTVWNDMAVITRESPLLASSLLGTG